MYSRVNLSIFLLTSFGRPLSPNNKSCVKTSFERSIYPNGRSNAKLQREGFDVEPRVDNFAIQPPTSLVNVNGLHSFCY